MVRIGLYMILLLSFSIGCSAQQSSGNPNSESLEIDLEKSTITERKSSLSNKSVPLNRTELNFYTSLKTTNLLLPEENSGVRQTRITHVVLHFISNAASKPHDPYNIEDIYSIFKNYQVSAHYMIGRDGEIYSLVSEDRVAFHAGSVGSIPGFPEYTDFLNAYSIGIELLGIGTKEEMESMLNPRTYDLIHPSHIGYTDAQYRSLEALLKDIRFRHPNVKYNRKHIVGHDEYAEGRKTDPGSLFNYASIGLK